jgi:hypothetical protein
LLEQPPDIEGEEEPELPAVAPGVLRVQQSSSDALSQQQISVSEQQQSAV